MKIKLLLLMAALTIFAAANAQAQDAPQWRHGEAPITAQCFEYEWSSSDNFKNYAKAYRIKKPETFYQYPGQYLGVPINDLSPLQPSWCSAKDKDCEKISLVKLVSQCSVKKSPESYEVLMDVSSEVCDSLSPNLYARCLDAKLVKLDRNMEGTVGIYGLFNVAEGFEQLEEGQDLVIAPLRYFGTDSEAGKRYVSEMQAKFDQGAPATKYATKPQAADYQKPDDCQSVDCHAERFYPLGWSNDGKYFAYFFEPYQFMFSGYKFAMVIQNIVSDKQVFRYDFKEFKGEGDFYDKQYLLYKQSFQRVWNENKKTFLNNLKKYNISYDPNASIEFVNPVTVGSRQYSFDFQYEINKKGLLGESIKKETIWASERSSGKKKVFSAEYNNELKQPLGTSIAGAFIAPDKKRMAALKLNRHYGFENTVFTPSIVGVHLTAGYKIEPHPYPLPKNCARYCDDEKFYPIGWSSDSRYFAFASDIDSETYQTYIFELAVLDLENNEVVHTERYTKGFREIEEEGAFDKYNFMYVWSNNKETYLKGLEPFGIEFNLGGKYEILNPIIVDGRKYSIEYEFEKVPHQLYSGSVIKKSNVWLVAKNLGRKKFSSGNFNERHKPLNIEVTGAIPVPNKESVLLISIMQFYGWEGTPYVTHFSLKNVHLTEGYE